MNVDLTALLPPLALMGTLVILAIPTPVAVFFASILFSQLAPSGLAGYFRHGSELAALFRSPGLISIPMFVLAGELAVAAGIAHRLCVCAESLAGGIAGAFAGRGGTGGSRLEVGLQGILGISLFATVSGSGPAAVVAEGKRLAGDLTGTGLPSSPSVAFAAAASMLCLVIPPSPALTLYAAASGGVTTLAFTASFVPGLLLALLLFATFHLMGGGAAEPRPGVTNCSAANVDGPDASARQNVFHGELSITLFALALPIIMGIAFFGGYLTAPEGAAFACAYAALYGWSRRVLNKAACINLLTRAAVTAGGVLFMAAMGGLFNAMLREHHLQDQFARMILGNYGHAGGLIAVTLIPLLAGCFVETPAIVTLVAPFLLPLAERSGIGVVQYGTVIAVASAIGLITPPFAAINAAVEETFGFGGHTTPRHLLPYIIAAVSLLALTALAPELSLWFPRWWGWKV